MIYLNKILSFLKGRKTYITGGVMIVLGLWQSDQSMILQGISFVFLRSGISNLNVRSDM